MAQRKIGSHAIQYLLGVCLPSSKQNATKIRVRKLEYDDHLLMYFNKFEFYYAHDPKRRCKTGDTVLIQNLPNKLTRLITHEVVDVIYPLGDIIDPITNKKIIAGKYREDIAEANKLYGELKSAFKYEKTQPRGRLEDKRDFTHKKSYIKYHEDPNNPEPYAIYP